MQIIHFAIMISSFNLAFVWMKFAINAYYKKWKWFMYLLLTCPTICIQLKGLLLDGGISILPTFYMKCRVTYLPSCHKLNLWDEMILKYPVT